MATNKKNKTSKKKKVEETTSKTNTEQQKKQAAVAATSNQAASTPGVLSKPQLAILILLAIGFSRLFQVKSAAIEENSPTCIAYLGAEACQHKAVQLLLHYKFHTALQTTGLILAGMLQCWNTEYILETYNALFVFSPLLTGAIALCFAAAAAQDNTQGGISSNQIWKQLMMALVLTVLCAPSTKARIPFYMPRMLQNQQPCGKTIPSLVLMVCVLIHLYEVYRILLQSSSAEVVRQLVVVASADTQQEVPTTAAAAAAAAATGLIVSFLAVDKFTNALIYAFVWYHLPDAHQRSFLATVSFLTVVEYLYLLPSLELVLRNFEAIQTLTLTLATFSAMSYFAPNIAWKNKLS